MKTRRASLLSVAVFGVGVYIYTYLFIILLFKYKCLYKEYWVAVFCLGLFVPMCGGWFLPFFVLAGF